MPLLFEGSDLKHEIEHEKHALHVIQLSGVLHM